ncbi:MULTISPECIES: hypothetical protein [Natronococcus]|uniref:Uncharacterized protein n=1 Tax=Natronococcus jeotgali DSM 18795 TaxID=1227498 RepID=L9WTC6_9EURY|nr:MULTISPECIES: hypothetical protein [Natronococcus]ELY52466.1 hypothetical protein C492_19142 [Natronococcus jeotgali DSM 18795]NKE35932.1 hypothetical protein [Natronococcus sp. JC468]
MTVHEPPESGAGDESSEGRPLELCGDDEEGVWMAVPLEADERAGAWLSVADADLCDLEEWR